ncbi:MAG: ABC transporter [Anaerolineaceae bacterium]|nr:ABC transporter [Anaerolineaceae bacterium]
MPLWQQITMLAWRSLVVTLRTPAVVIPSLIISVFFLLVYEATLGDAANFFLSGQSYLGFILPLSIVSAALSGAGTAGQAIVRDIENGYFDKLLLTPVSRGAVLLGPMIAGAIVLVLQTGLVTIVGLFMGLDPATGIVGLLTMLLFALLLGIAFAGFTVGIALRSGNAAATQGASFLFFPLSFLTATFVPVDLLSGWIKTAAVYNPITYILEAMRTLLNTGWDAEIMARGFASILLMAAITYTFAIFSLRARVRRK